MAAESIIAYKKPEFPKTEINEGATVTTIEYIGLASAIDSELPSVGSSWGDYDGQVKSVTKNPTENLLYTDATVRLELTTDAEGFSTGTLGAVSYEIRWVNVERDLYEHPQFAIAGGGASQLTDEDVKAIELWKERDNAGLLGDFQYFKSTGEIEDLSTNAKLFARGINLGQETWTDKAPVAAKISEYVGGPPPTTDAGDRVLGGPAGFPNLPSGYEWRKETADSIKSGGETRWNLTEEWAGAKKVLIDKNNVYWAAP